MRKNNPAREALSRAVNKAIAAGNPVIVEVPPEPRKGRMVNLTQLPESELTDWYRELLRRGWVWLIEEER